MIDMDQIKQTLMTGSRQSIYLAIQILRASNSADAKARLGIPNQRYNELAQTAESVLMYTHLRLATAEDVMWKSTRLYAKDLKDQYLSQLKDRLQGLGAEIVEEPQP